MESFDDIGAAIYSLSIGEPRPSLQADPMDAFDESDDLMDIDSVDVSLCKNDEGRTHHADEDRSRSSQHEEDGHSSFLETLNPTELGARYALTPRKLLKTVPHSLSESEHDYEFDTSDASPVPFSPRVSSLRSPGGVQQDCQWGSQESRVPMGLAAANQAPTLGNSILGSPHGSSSVQIHHHHYYTEKQGDPAGHQILQRQFGVSALNPNTHLQPHDAVARKCACEGAVSREASHQSMLPSPWDSAAAPAEKTPYILSSYLQLFVNLFISVYALQVVVSMIQAVRSDVAHKMEVEANNILVEIASCERSYRENNCSPDLIVPALEKMCARWAKCMNQDPFKGGNRSSISAQTIGILLNSLIEPLSFKFLSVVAFLIVVVFACNFGFGYFRAKAYYGWNKN